MPKDGLEENEVKLDGQGKPLWLCLEMTIYFVVPDYHDKFPKACMLTGDATNTDPVCYTSPHHHIVEEAIEAASRMGRNPRPYVMRRVQSASDLRPQSAGK